MELYGLEGFSNSPVTEKMSLDSLIFVACMIILSPYSDIYLYMGGPSVVQT